MVPRHIAAPGTGALRRTNHSPGAARGVLEAVKTAGVVSASCHHRAESPVLMKVPMKGKPAAMKYPGSGHFHQCRRYHGKESFKMRHGRGRPKTLG